MEYPVGECGNGCISEPTKSNLRRRGRGPAVRREVAVWREAAAQEVGPACLPPAAVWSSSQKLILCSRSLPFKLFSVFK